MADTGRLDLAELHRRLADVVRLPLLADAELRPDATMFAHGRSLPPVPPARPRS